MIDFNVVFLSNSTDANLAILQSIFQDGMKKKKKKKNRNINDFE